MMKKAVTLSILFLLCIYPVRESMAQGCCMWTAKAFLALPQEKQDELTKSWGHMFGVGIGVVLVSNRGIATGMKESREFIEVIDENYAYTLFYDLLKRYPNKYAYEVYGDALGQAIGKGLARKHFNSPTK
jgi:hypothetical protein